MDDDTYIELSTNPVPPCCDVRPMLAALQSEFPHLYVPDDPRETITGSVYVDLTCRPCHEQLEYPMGDDVGRRQSA
jgi:hypothetical protein